MPRFSDVLVSICASCLRSIDTFNATYLPLTLFIAPSRLSVPPFYAPVHVSTPCWQPFGHPEGIFPWGHLNVWLLDSKGNELGQRLSLPMVHDAAARNWACNGTDRMYVPRPSSA
jgi:hypothetical protein